MAHVRQQIREAAKLALTGLPTTGNNVFSSRVYTLQERELPAINIYTANEESEVLAITNTGTRLSRNLELAVDADVDRLQPPVGVLEAAERRTSRSDERPFQLRTVDGEVDLVAGEGHVLSGSSGR